MLMSSTADNAMAYFQKISELLTKLRITNHRKQGVSLDDGFDQATDMLASVKASACKIMLIGNGGSAAIASHQAIDFWKMAGIHATAFNDPVQLTCLSNDCGYENVFSKAIEMFAQPGDLLIAISSAGRSRNIIYGAHAARERDCSVITFAGFNPDAPLLACGDLNFYIDSNCYGHVEIAHLAIIHYLADTMHTRQVAGLISSLRETVEGDTKAKLARPQGKSPQKRREPTSAATRRLNDGNNKSSERGLY